MSRIRPYTPADAGNCLSVMRRAIAQLTARDYPADQIAAWLARCDSAQWMHGRLTGDYSTILATDGNDRAVGFSNLANNGHVNMLFIDPDHGGKGLATALLAQVESMARDRHIARLFAEGSLTAQRAFQKAGFAAVSRRLVHLGTVGIMNTAFEKALTPDAPPPPRGPTMLAQEWVTRFNAGDADGGALLYHRDATRRRMIGDQAKGRDAIKAMLAAEFAGPDSARIPDMLHEAGDLAILDWQNPQGRRGRDFFTVRDGLIVFQRD